MAEAANMVFGTMASAIKGSGRSGGGGGRGGGSGGGNGAGGGVVGSPSDRVLGAAASLGLCLAILRLVGSAYTASRHLERGGGGGGEPSELSSPQPTLTGKSSGGGKSSASGSSVSAFLLSYVRSFLKRMLLEDDVDVFDDDNVNSNLNSSASITYSGSCHCGSVGFEVVAPRSLQARDGVGKIQYRHTKVKTSNFRVFQGQGKLKTYYVKSDSLHDRGAHAFCQDCGVHILYAPWKNSPHIFINMNCLSEGVRSASLVGGGVGTGMLDPILDSVPADFDNQSAVSEVSGDSRWNLFLHHDSNASSAGGTSTLGCDDASIADYSVHSYYARKVNGAPSSSSSISPSATAQTADLSSGSAYGDESTVRSYKSSATARSSIRASRTNGSISLQPLQIPKVSPAEQNLSPALRDQMKKYMKRHLSTGGGGGDSDPAKKDPGGVGGGAGTIRTMKKETVHAVTRAAVGNDPNKYA